jgi:hypothetical protein
MAEYRQKGDVESYQASVDSAKEWLADKQASLRIYQSDLREANVDLNSAEAAFNAALNDPTKTPEQLQALSTKMASLRREIQQLEEVQIPSAQEKVANAEFSVEKSQEALQESIAFRQANSDQSTASGESKTNVENAASTTQDTSQADTTRRVTSVDITNGQTTRYYSDGSSETDSADGTTTFDDGSGIPVIKKDEDPTNGNAGQPDYSGNAGAVPGVQVFDDGSTLQTFDDGSTLATDSEGGVSSSPSPDVPTGKVSSNLVRGMGSGGGGAKAEWKDAKDLRAILRVPKSYLTSNTDPSSVLKQFGGIIFPYTPTISFDHSASYSPLNTLHSNYTQFFYKNSAISAINLTAKFTVQKEEDGVVLLGIIHLLRALTKMRFGPDKDSGAPPPVCRLEAYGDYMLRNVPVAVASFRHDLPDGVDYIAVGKKSTMFGNNIVPVLSTITLTLNPMYSRAEMQEAGVNDWLNGKQRGKGYL